MRYDYEILFNGEHMAFVVDETSAIKWTDFFNKTKGVNATYKKLEEPNYDEF